jgi:hypothetical protein
MDLYPRSFTEGLEARMTGPGKWRFAIQPLFSIALGVRDGVTDAKLGKPPYFICVLLETEGKGDALKSGLKSIAMPLTFGIVLDMILQWVMFQTLFLLPAVMAGTILVALPYALARALSNRIVRRWYFGRGDQPASSIISGS